MARLGCSEEESVEKALESLPPFAARIPEEVRWTTNPLHTLQMNIGYRCNLACKHCHLSCSPKRTEEMNRETMRVCLEVYRAGGFTGLDITGGAPEMNQDLGWLLDEAHAMGAPTIVRTNLCILLDPAYSHFIDDYARCDVTLYASLPSCGPDDCDEVRGRGVFDASIKALRRLNDVGYGTGAHDITLVFNPVGAELPPNQGELERVYKAKLLQDFGVEFTNLIAITNIPGGRFAKHLEAQGALDAYIAKLAGAFNPATTASMMCRNQVSVDWQGKLYDCDFNQAMGVPLIGKDTIFDWADTMPERRRIAFRNWCYACTAGVGSS